MGGIYVKNTLRHLRAFFSENTWSCKIRLDFRLFNQIKYRVIFFIKKGPRRSVFENRQSSKWSFEAVKLDKISTDIYTPIEIDQQVYYIPSAVNDLIEKLYEKTVSLKSQIDNGLPKNTE